jgi:hypothetical protein
LLADLLPAKQRKQQTMASIEDCLRMRQWDRARKQLDRVNEVERISEMLSIVIFDAEVPSDIVCMLFSKLKSEQEKRRSGAYFTCERAERVFLLLQRLHHSRLVQVLPIWVRGDTPVSFESGQATAYK